MLRPGGDVRQHEIRTRQDPERVEVVLADPGRVHPQRLRVQRLVGDVRDERVRIATVVLVVIVAEGKVAEI